jgi:hypothetical protein
MHPAQSALALIKRDVALHNSGIQPVILELSLAKRSGKIASFVYPLLKSNQESAS